MKEETKLKENSEVYQRLHLIVCSDVRRRLLLSLLEGKKPLHTLCSEIGISAPAAIHALRDLKEGNCVREDERRYALTFIGRGFALKMIDLVTMATVMKKHENFWLKHDTSGIPDHLLGMMLLLSDSIILESPPVDIFQVYRRGVAFFEDTNVKVFKAVTTNVGIPEAATFLNKFAADQIPIHLVLAEDILRDSAVHANLVNVQRTLGKRCELSVLRHDPKLTQLWSLIA
jgi:predicted transcriptional regulator